MVFSLEHDKSYQKSPEFIANQLVAHTVLPKRRMKKIGTLHNNFFEKMAIFISKM
jgi:hypothetical protein